MPTCYTHTRFEHARCSHTMSDLEPVLTRGIRKRAQRICSLAYAKMRSHTLSPRVCVCVCARARAFVFSCVARVRGQREERKRKKERREGERGEKRRKGKRKSRETRRVRARSEACTRARASNRRCSRAEMYPASYQQHSRKIRRGKKIGRLN